MSDLPVLIEEVEKSFKTGFLSLKTVKPVKGISFNVQPGEIFGLLGPNGAGKTTTLKMVTGLIFPDAGSIKIFGISSEKASARKRVGFLPENPWFYEYLTAREFLRMTGGIFSIPRKKLDDRIDMLLEKLNILHAADVQMRKFSKGMQQRAGLAQALINDPDLVILDEPQSGLDPIGRREVRQLILDLKKSNKTVLFSSHILSDVEDICDSIAILNRGVLKQSGKISDLVSEGETYVEVLSEGNFDDILTVSNQLNGKIEPEKTISGARISFSTDDIETDEVLKALMNNNHKIKKVDTHRRSLEDIFIESSKSDEQA